MYACLVVEVGVEEMGDEGAERVRQEADGVVEEDVEERLDLVRGGDGVLRVEQGGDGYARCAISRGL